MHSSCSNCFQRQPHFLHTHGSFHHKNNKPVIRLQFSFHFFFFFQTAIRHWDRRQGENDLLLLSNHKLPRETVLAFLTEGKQGPQGELFLDFLFFMNERK